MKKITLLTMLLIISLGYIQAQLCQKTVHSNTIRISSDTTITYNSFFDVKSWAPCIGKSIHLDSTVTIIDTFYLREGNKLIIDSTSTLAGGFVIYADSGSYVDCNFAQVQYLYYTPYTILVDTNTWGSRILCNDIQFDFSQMISPHDCYPTNILEQEKTVVQISTEEESWHIHFLDQHPSLLNVYNIQGQVIEKFILTNNDITISKSNLPKGIYVLQFLNKNHFESIQIQN